MASAGAVWLFYLALEPYVRRRWPQRFIGWSWLLAGNVRDPLVGRDLLVGGLFALAPSLLISLALKWPGLISGLMTAQPLMAQVVTLQGLRGLTGFFLLTLPSQVFASLGNLFLLMLLSIMLRKEWLAFGVALVFITLLNSLRSGFGGLLAIGHVSFLLVVLTRYGLLASASYIVCFSCLIKNYPITADFSAWYADGTFFALGVVAVICGYGFYTSLGGQKVFAGKLLEE